MPGARLTAGTDLQIPAGGLRLRVTDAGKVEADPLVLHLRTDMWAYWLEESIAAATEARTDAANVAEHIRGDEDALTHALVLELRTSMRAVTSAAFAIDGFYAAVKARSGAHPDEAIWQKRRTPRHSQVFETLRYHVKMRNPGAAAARTLIQELFRFRGWAVHPGSKFREPVYRVDVHAAVDWQFAAFRAENAVNAARCAVNLLDVLVTLMHRGSEELRQHHPVARRAMNGVLDHYATTGLPEYERADDPLVEA